MLNILQYICPPKFTFVAVLICLSICSHLFAKDDDDAKKEEEAHRELQLKNMKRSAAQHILTAADGRKEQFKFHESAIVRFSNPVAGTKDGTVYMWTDRGRPQALLKLYTFNNKSYTHEWLSLSESAFAAERNGKAIWEPAEPGITFRELPGAPKPAESAVERLRQMKTLSAKFASTYTARHLDAQPFELRLLTTPLHRYETTDDSPTDGAMFSFVQSTAPIGLLLLETRRTREGNRWHYAFASMVTGPVTARYGEKEIFSLEKDYVRRDPKLTYLQLHGQPFPKE
jgi:hypothetical protein